MAARVRSAGGEVMPLRSIERRQQLRFVRSFASFIPPRIVSVDYDLRYAAAAGCMKQPVVYVGNEDS